MSSGSVRKDPPPAMTLMTAATKPTAKSAANPNGDTPKAYPVLTRSEESTRILDRFDILPLLVATDGAVAAFGRDVRRLRPNILVGGVEGLQERGWPGAELHIADVIVRLDSLRGRCHMTTVDPDTLQVDPGVLRDIVSRFGNRLALNLAVVRGGTIQVGDRVSLVRR